MKRWKYGLSTGAGEVAKIFITDIQPNQDVSSVFIVSDKQLRTARNGTQFLTLKLVDKTGEVTGRIWEGACELADAIPSRGVVAVRARSELYRDELQLQVREISVISVDQVDPADFLPVCPTDPELLYAQLKKLAASVKRRSLHQLLRSILGDHKLMGLFMRAPAAKSMHHAYIGGLLEHSVSVGKLVTRICEHYPDLDRDLLIAGAILHDIGKVHEFVYDLSIDYSNAGRLLGHMILGVEIMEEKTKALKSFPDEDALLLKHLILSHHGEAEFGAVKLPMTREAFVLHFADDLDAKMNNLSRLLAEVKSGDGNWTGYQQLFGRFFYKGPCPAEGDALPAVAHLQESVDMGPECVQLSFPMPEGKRKGDG